MVLTLLERLALRRRRQGANGIWTAVAFAAFLLRQYQKRAANDVVSLREELRPGESLLITHTTTTRG
ncbi:MAG: hypothetical protein ABL966_06875 [Acidimicrobiales bacterium]